jgi:hypothetical protein
MGKRCRLVSAIRANLATAPQQLRGDQRRVEQIEGGTVKAFFCTAGGPER